MTRRAWIYFVAVSALWGMPYLFIKVAMDDGLSPTVVAFARSAIGAAVLLPVALRAGALRQLRDRRGSVVLVAALDIAVPFALVAAAEQSISSSLAGILVASTPLFLALLAVWVDHSERVTGRRLLGLVLGFGGVVVLLGGDVGFAGDDLTGALLVLLASLGYAAATLLVKRRFAGVSPVGLTAGALSVSALALLLPALASAPETWPSGEAAGSVLVLGTACTAAAFLLYYALVAEAGAGRAAVITYAAPAFAVVLGVSVLGEAFTLATAAGLALILLGSAWATRGAPVSPAEAAAPGSAAGPPPAAARGPAP